MLETYEQPSVKYGITAHAIRERPTGTLLVEGYEKRICLDVSDQDNFRAIDIPDDISGVL